MSATHIVRLELVDSCSYHLDQERWRNKMKKAKLSLDSFEYSWRLLTFEVCILLSPASVMICALGQAYSNDACLSEGLMVSVLDLEKGGFLTPGANFGLMLRV